MRSYLNKKLETVNVSKEHLDTAVELKQLLQKDSPSNRCSWAKHKQLMIQEGFEDSENSENYRQMIKAHQKSIGELPSAEKHADMVVTSKLESYKALVGENKWQTVENQKYLREINKGKKEIITGALFVEEVTNAIDKVFNNIDWSAFGNRPFTPVENPDGTRMVALITDWHIGADVDVEGNRYNLEVAKERINNYLEQITAMGLRQKVRRIDLVYMGDMVEGGYMREGQAYDIEFPVSEQMAIGAELITDAIVKLSEFFEVEYSGFSGNHDRMNQQNKNGNITGDSAMVVVNAFVKKFVNTAKIDNIFYKETHHSYARLIDINGVNIKLVHGHNEKKDDRKKINDHSFRDGVNYDIIAYGHFHHFLVLEVGINKFELRVGSTKGSDDYSETLGLGSAPSQAAILIDSTGRIDINRIGLT